MTTLLWCPVKRCYMFRHANTIIRETCRSVWLDITIKWSFWCLCWFSMMIRTEMLGQSLIYLRIIEMLLKTAVWIHHLLHIPYLRCASGLTILWWCLTTMGEVFPLCVLGRGGCGKGKWHVHCRCHAQHCHHSHLCTEASVCFMGWIDVL
jgi:hypothetical protein